MLRRDKQKCGADYNTTWGFSDWTVKKGRRKWCAVGFCGLGVFFIHKMFFSLWAQTHRAEPNIQVTILGSCGALASASQYDSYCTTPSQPLCRKQLGYICPWVASKPTKKLPSLAGITSPPVHGISSSILATC